MKYPYIGELKNGNGGIVMFSGDSFGAQLNSKGSGWESKDIGAYLDDEEWIEGQFKNITRKYLEGKCVKIKSPEHSEFVQKLAFNAGILWCDGDDMLSLVPVGLTINFRPNGMSVGDARFEQITIPLPPECEGEDEWPKVGSSVEWGHTGKGEVKSLSDGFAWVKLDNKDYTTVYISSLRKPKTPEQELREFLHLLWRENNEDFDDFADIAVLHLTKKGEGGGF